MFRSRLFFVWTAICLGLLIAPCGLFAQESAPATEGDSEPTVGQETNPPAAEPEQPGSVEQAPSPAPVEQPPEPSPAPVEETSAVQNETVQATPDATPEAASEEERQLEGRDKVDVPVREFFDRQTNDVWKYLRPVFLVRTGAIYEDWDKTNRVFRQAGFKLWDAQIGFRGDLDPYSINQDWKLGIGYKITGNFASGVSGADTYMQMKVFSHIFSSRLKVGVMKVPFLYSELVGDGVMYFHDRPQYVKPYGSAYLTDFVHIGLGRHAGLEYQAGFLDDAITLQAGVFNYLSKPKEEIWNASVYATRLQLDTRDWIHDRIHFELGGGFYYQKKLPLIFENDRYSIASDGRFYCYGFFLGGEWTMQTMNDAINAGEYERMGYKNSFTRAMGYQIFTGYSYLKREYEIALRYQWWDPDDTNFEQPMPQSANQALRWITVAASWCPVDLFRLLVQYTYKMELEAVGTEEFSEDRLKDVANNQFVMMFQLSL